jgi:hypothetical protein
MATTRSIRSFMGRGLRTARSGKHSQDGLEVSHELTIYVDQSIWSVHEHQSKNLPEAP